MAESSVNIHQGNCLTGLGDTNRIRGHSGSDSLFVFILPPSGTATVKSHSQRMVTHRNHQLDLTGFLSL